MQRVLMVGLDGFEISLAEAMMAEGGLPNLRRLRERSARFRLHHGVAKYSGLAWEEVSTGLSPDDGGRWSVVTFDPANYRVRQLPTNARPFVADLPVKTVAFDVPYCDLSQSDHVFGISNWGAHDPGVPSDGRPVELKAEFEARFGCYPAPEWIYGFCWPSVEKTNALGEALARAADVRAEAALWLLKERFPDWELGMVVAGEPHSAIEPLWHGVDPSHPLHCVESAAPAAAALRRVYTATDVLVGKLADAFPDAALLVFAMHGMGANDADLPAMALVPELLYRRDFGGPHMRTPDWKTHLPGGMPLFEANDDWTAVMRRLVPGPGKPRRWERRLRRLLGLKPRVVVSEEVAWMPAARYARVWPRMKSFALPAFYDARVRVNLAGREGRGRVARRGYAAECQAVIDLLAECRDPVSGQPVLRDARRNEKDPLALDPWEADIAFDFQPCTVGFVHPTLGTVGPIPYRRTGGHTGAHGFLYLAGAGIGAGEEKTASSFDVVPTAVDLLGVTSGPKLSGRSLVSH
jgi:predicted AlkP superfamily phosphohydrolase/phosphomutase